MRRLDRGRDFAECIPRSGRTAYVQDNLGFDVDGYCVQDGDPPPKEVSTGPPAIAAAPSNGPATNGAVSISTVTLPLPELAPRTVSAWQTMKFPDLRRLLFDGFGYKPPNTIAALNFLTKQNLVVKD